VRTRQRLLLADLVAIMTGQLLALAFHQWRWPMTDAAARSHLLLAVATLPLWTLAMVAIRFSTARRNVRRVDEWRNVAVIAVLGACATVVVADVAGFDERSSHWAWTVAVAVAGTLTIEREVARRRFRQLRRDRRLTRRVVIVGADESALSLARRLEQMPELGYQPVGLVRTGTADAALQPTDRPLPILGEVSHTAELVRHVDATGAVLSLCSLDCATVNELTRQLTDAGCHVTLSTGLDDIDTSRLRPLSLDGRALLYVEPCVRTGWHAAAKRVFDVIVSVVALTLTAPVLAVAAVAIRTESPGPVVFRQWRVGRDGAPFQILKLRTMVADAETRRRELLDRNEADGPMFKIRHDPRITRVGGLLRRLSIDELPQFWNVLRGEMSVVGPRPALPEEVAAWPEPVRGRLRVLPGITGMWQVSGRSDSSFDEYVRLDLAYVDNWSLAHDLEIVARTVGVVATAKGAR
jgi:exopolysaccharide biosynthesis polyprenyl glycosylphosphotransferase